MFTELKPLLHSGSQLKLTITAGADGIMKVVVMPASTKGEEIALSQPFAMAATPEELDAGFNDALNTFCNARAELAQQVDATTAILNAAKEAQSKKAVKSLKGATEQLAAACTDVGDDDDDKATDADPADAPPPKADTVVKPAEKANSGTDLLALFDQFDQ